MNALAATTPIEAAARKRLRVMIVDDAAVVRGLFARWVTAEPDLDVVALLRTGRDAVDEIERADPDVVVLDVEMPELDGISALPLLLAKKRDLVVIMASTVTRRNAEISLKALALGAADYIPKPSSPRDANTSDNFRRELIEKIRTLGQRARRPQRRRPVGAPDPGAAADRAAADAADAAARVADRLLDRRAAGARCRARPVQRLDRARAGADHPAYAADLHRHPRRAPDAFGQDAGARGDRR